MEGILFPYALQRRLRVFPIPLTLLTHNWCWLLRCSQSCFIGIPNISSAKFALVHHLSELLKNLNLLKPLDRPNLVASGIQMNNRRLGRRDLNHSNPAIFFSIHEFGTVVSWCIAHSYAKLRTSHGGPFCAIAHAKLLAYCYERSAKRGARSPWFSGFFLV